MTSNEGAKIPQGGGEKTSGIPKQVSSSESRDRPSSALRSAIEKLRHTLSIREIRAKAASKEPGGFTPFPEGHVFAPLNVIAELPPEGQKLVIEMLPWARDDMRQDSTKAERDETKNRLADEVAKVVDPNYPSKYLDEEYDASKLDPESRAAFYRDTFYRMLGPLDDENINRVLRIIRPKQKFYDPELVGGPGFPSGFQVHYYQPKIQDIDRTKL